MGRALVLILVVFVMAALVYLVAAPHLLPHTASSSPPLPPAPSGLPDTSQIPTSSAPSTTATSGPVPVPVSPEQRSHDSLESRRTPYYNWLRQNEGAYVADCHASTDDPATLCLYLTTANDSWVKGLVAEAVQPYAANYGFNHAIIYMPSPPGSVDRYTRTAEATPDTSGNWHAFFE